MRRHSITVLALLMLVLGVNSPGFAVVTLCLENHHNSTIEDGSPTVDESDLLHIQNHSKHEKISTFDLNDNECSSIECNGGNGDDLNLTLVTPDTKLYENALMEVTERVILRKYPFENPPQ